MKRLSVFLLVAALFFIAGNGFAPNSRQESIKISGCELNVDEMGLLIEPDKVGPTSPVSFNVRVVQDDKVVSIGMARLEMLNLPARRFSVRVPLSQQLKSGQSYQIFVIAENNSKERIEKEFIQVKAEGSSSKNFFTRKFSPIPELKELRESIGAICVKTEMGIN
ncbi:MAG: hypothetical protein PWR01_4264 [Clostridiales bacterium]|jgi:hypothetical protein|nr:hypothetical protein [Clostridiales bacterium]MDN5283191.1 hypothetical protein [Candidatus Ozemobacter sp.]